MCIHTKDERNIGVIKDDPHNNGYDNYYCKVCHQVF